jgi:hypothetical protein
MTPEAVREALEATKAWDHRFQVHITGGEPFLNFPLLIHAAEIAAELGISSYVETNAGWCLSPDIAQERFADLKDAGLQAVLISCSPFHAETIPPQRTELAFRKAREVFGAHGVILYLPQWVDALRRFDPAKPTPLSSYVEAFGPEHAGKLFWEGYGLISGGRSGYALGHLAARQPAHAFQGDDCRREILHAHHSHFDLYGNYISWFCGGLVVGDWRRLPQIMEEFQAGRHPPLIETLLTSGPYGLMQMAVAEHGYQPVSDGYAGKCHLCVDIRTHLHTHGDFDELRPGEFYQMIERERVGRQEND